MNMNYPLLMLLIIGRGVIRNCEVMARQNTNVCTGVPDGQYVIDPESCDHFYICSDGLGQLAPCPGGDWFDLSNQWCASPDTVDCHLYTTTTTRPLLSTLDPIENGIDCPATDNPFVIQFLPSLIDCERYYICYHGHPKPMDCLDGFYWNQARQMCDYPSNANCPLNPTPIDLICAGSTSGRETILPHPTECGLYYYCVNGVPKVQQCPLLYHFDYESQECMIKDRARCYLNRNIV